MATGYGLGLVPVSLFELPLRPVVTETSPSLVLTVVKMFLRVHHL